MLIGVSLLLDFLQYFIRSVFLSCHYKEEEENFYSKQKNDGSLTEDTYEAQGYPVCLINFLMRLYNLKALATIGALVWLICEIVNINS